MSSSKIKETLVGAQQTVLGPRLRLLRVIEYVGDEGFIREAIERRGVKGRHNVREGCYIQEGIIGETGEVMREVEGDVTF